MRARLGRRTCEIIQRSWRTSSTKFMGSKRMIDLVGRGDGQRERVVGRTGPVHRAIYGASDVNAFRVKNINFMNFSDKGIDCLVEALKLIHARHGRARIAESLGEQHFGRGDG